ncbi:ABC transporter ATP-binding protein [Amylibacter marinus]|uniref:ABC transporter ATP-binding protein n=1 Tax=Amylibacter marinus TaxID=1475483 RepID=A0ABQ5VSP7_9RHOB|nr:Fur family transcriptional regulator [Amylibacter marinus]GLQ34206.1 ABC transporter ATP-binding protein [Amylibacter marinus]
MRSFEIHDHDHCVDTALNIAKERCAAEKLQLTPTRLRVLEILLHQHRAIGAYEILAQLDAEGLGSQPPVAYRALDFLVKQGFAHKIEKLNAFVACSQPAVAHRPGFLICRCCDKVAEEPSLADARVSDTALSAGFEIESAVIEIEGLCIECKEHGEKCA